MTNYPLPLVAIIYQPIMAWKNPTVFWLVVSTPLKNMKVSWDYYSQYMENKIHIPNHQPVLHGKNGVYGSVKTGKFYKVRPPSYVG